MAVLQVCVPIVGPSLIATIVALLWMSLDADFVMKRNVILDLTPWRLRSTP